MKGTIALLMMMIAFGSILGLSLTGSSDSRTLFKEFQREFSKVYSDSEEEKQRYSIFSSNLKKIREHNAKKNMSWKMGVNAMTDYTDEERSQLLGYRQSHRPQSLTKASIKNKFGNKENRMIEETVDWRLKGVVTPVKQQGNCGSCWAFGATENIESYAKINDGILMELSTQQLTSCTPNTLHCGGFGGCKGSIPQLAYGYTDLFGISSNEDYPYISGMSQQDEACKYNSKTTPPKVQIRGYEALPSNDMEAVMAHLSNVGPLTVSVDASGFSWYGSGVYEGCDFDGNIDINHVVQLVGYGNDSEHGLYWLIRNSWGTTVGEEGYIRIRRFQEKKCGTDYTPLNGTACVDGGEETQRVCGYCGILFDTSYPIGVEVVYN